METLKKTNKSQHDEKREPRAISQNVRKQRGLEETIKADREAFKAAVEAGKACDIGSAFLKLETDRKALQADLGKTLDAIEGILTPDQKAKLEGCLQAPKAKSAQGGEETE